MTKGIEMTEQRLKRLIDRYGFVPGARDISAMGEWFVTLDNKEFTIVVSRDRAGHGAIELSSKLRPRPRAHMRQWSLSHLRGFVEGLKEHYVFKDLEEQFGWLEKNQEVLFDSTLLNSDALNKWAVKASRRLFGQDPRT